MLGDLPQHALIARLRDGDHAERRKRRRGRRGGRRRRRNRENGEGGDEQAEGAEEGEDEGESKPVAAKPLSAVPGGDLIANPDAVADVFAQAEAAAPVPAAGQDQGETVNAPLVGTFYAAPAPGEAPFVKAGDQGRKGQTVCVLEAMKMMSEVPAPADCIIEEVLVKDGELVGFDAPMFRIREV